VRETLRETFEKLRTRILAVIAALGIAIVGAYFYEKVYPWLVLPRPSTAYHAGEPYVIVWPANDHDNLSHPYPSAPPIALRIEPTDVADWWKRSGDIGRPQTAAVDNKPPTTLYLQVSSPSFASPHALSAELLCPHNALENCLMGSARMFLDRDDLDLDGEDVVFGHKPLEVAVSRWGQTQERLFEYWTYDAGIGHGVKWLGWDCTSLHKPNDPAIFDVAGSPLLANYRQCYSPDPWASPWGKRRHTTLNRLWVRDGKFIFTYRNRFVHTDEEEIPSESVYPGAARAMLFFSAWDMLNRMESNAISAPADSAEIGMAQVQSVLCEAAGATARKWQADLEAQYPVDGEKPETASLNRFLRSQSDGRLMKRLNYAALGCDYALDVAKRHTVDAAKQLVPPLAKVEKAQLALAQIDPSRYENQVQPALDARIAAISAASGPHTPALLEPVAEQIHYSGFVWPGTPEATVQKTKLARAESLLDLLPAGLSEDDRLRLYDEMASRYGYLQDYPKQLALLDRECEDLRSHHGNQANRLLVPLRERMVAMWRAKDFDGSSASLNDLRTLWQAVPTSAPDLPPKEDSRGWPMTGFEIAYFRSLIAFKQGDFAQAAVEMEEVIHTMAERLGQDNQFVAAARFHLDEVRHQRRDTAASVRGGGFLPPGWV